VWLAQPLYTHPPCKPHGLQDWAIPACCDLRQDSRILYMAADIVRPQCQPAKDLRRVLAMGNSPF
jgi:hypothetical protein